jgi:hypothetical protein
VFALSVEQPVRQVGVGTPLRLRSSSLNRYQILWLDFDDRQAKRAFSELLAELFDNKRFAWAEGWRATVDDPLLAGSSKKRALIRERQGWNVAITEDYFVAISPFESFSRFDGTSPQATFGATDAIVTWIVVLDSDIGGVARIANIQTLFMLQNHGHSDFQRESIDAVAAGAASAVLFTEDDAGRPGIVVLTGAVLDVINANTTVRYGVGTRGGTPMIFHGADAQRLWIQGPAPTE